MTAIIGDVILDIDIVTKDAMMAILSFALVGLEPKGCQSSARTDELWVSYGK